MNGDVHVQFWIRELNGNIFSTVTLSHPGIEKDSKGLVVRQLMWYMIWV